jgi:carboxymethylenebutenolidase
MSGEQLSISTPEGAFNAYVARPAAAEAPAVVVIQEIFGVNAVMRAVTEKLAAAGFIALCPDLFWRIEPGVDITDQSEAEWKKAFSLMQAFDIDKGMDDIQATITAARALPQSTGKVGAVGYCLGGRLAYLAATRTDVDASVGYYGVTIENYLGEADKIVRPLMLHIAEEDQFVPKAAQAQVIEALSKLSHVKLFTYPGRDHAFARPGGAHYHAGDATLADNRTVDFFKTNLG